MKSFLVSFAFISASVFGVNITDTALKANHSSKNINLRNIKSYNDYYASSSLSNKNWGESTSIDDEQCLEELYEVFSHLSNLELNGADSFKTSKGNDQKYLNYIRAIESKDINLLKTTITNCKTGEVPLLVLFKYGFGKLSEKDLFNLTQSLLSDKKVKKRIKLNGKDHEGDTALLFAAENNLKDVFKLLVQNGANANEVLHVLMRDAQYDLIKWLINQKALKKIKLNLNTKNINGDTLLLVAAQDGNEEMFDFLVQNGASVNATNKNGQTALGIAASKGFKNYIAKKSKNASDQKSEKPTDITSIVLLKEDEHYSKKKLMFEKELLNRLKKNEVPMPLFDAIGIGSEMIVKYLVEKLEADVNAGGFAGSPLHCAVALLHENIAKYLINHGANVNKENKQKDTALHIATELEQGSMVKLLVENGASVNTANDQKETPLIIATRTRNKNIVEYLVKHGAKVNCENIEKKTPLILASSKGDENIVRYLIEHGADINHEDQNKDDALILASKNGYEIVARYLVNQGADVTHENKEKETALLFASAYGYNKLVTSLIEHGANINQKDIGGHSPIFLATIMKNKNTIEYLKNHGAKE